MPPSLDLHSFIASFAASPLAPWAALDPWEITSRAEALVRELLANLPAGEYQIEGGIALHRSARIEAGAVLKGPLVVGAGCLVAAGAYLRGGNWLAEDCVVGPGSELKSSFLFAGAKLAHFNFVGDSLLGAGVNLEAGSIVCNYRNERPNSEVLVRLEGGLHPTGRPKFGALVGDGARLGANAVLAPGALLRPGTVIQRAALCDQEMP